jgi:hypothetical protein
MKRPTSVAALTELGRVRLSKHFFMREMLYSEVSNHYGLPNVPEDPALAVEAGTRLCEKLLEPLYEAFGGIVVRSAYRSPTLNEFCHRKYVAGESACYCSDNLYSAARHIWDRRDDKGLMGATASVLVPAYLGLYEQTADCEPLAWWIRDHLPEYAEVTFYPWQCVFNIRWYEGEADQAIYEDAGPNMGDDRLITKKGMPNFGLDHRDRYRVLEGIARA